MTYDTFVSALGTITLASNGKAITALHIQGDRHFKKIPKDWVRDAKSPILKKAAKEVNAYLKGALKEFTVPVEADGTGFQKSVWKEISKVPYGMTVSYGVIAAKISNPKAVRAVGTAVGRNPVCVIVPCHRILRDSGALGDYVAGLKRKQFLLDRETATAKKPRKQR